jgi:hypothetical protein
LRLALDIQGMSLEGVRFDRRKERTVQT